MFTGIVEEVGDVVSLERRSDVPLWDGTSGEGAVLTVRASAVLEGAYLGCSICVSGACLTATGLDAEGSTFTVGLAPETLRRTHLGGLAPGSKVNLERASEIGGRNSGHFVQGHVDATGEIADKYADGDSLFVVVRAPADLLRYIVPKGFIAVDGTSLTVVDVDPAASTFSFMLVSYTQGKVIIPQKSVGDLVNLEVDVLGKYSEAALNLQVLPRLEALESRVAGLERELRALRGGGARSQA
jgi:riboflavin synthase